MEDASDYIKPPIDPSIQAGLHYALRICTAYIDELTADEDREIKAAEDIFHRIESHMK